MYLGFLRTRGRPTRGNLGITVYWAFSSDAVSHCDKRKRMSLAKKIKIPFVSGFYEVFGVHTVYWLAYWGILPYCLMLVSYIMSLLITHDVIMTSHYITQVNYHNIFGHMRDLYEVHEKFWNTTLLPCLKMVRHSVTSHCTYISVIKHRQQMIVDL